MKSLEKRLMRIEERVKLNNRVTKPRQDLEALRKLTTEELERLDSILEKSVESLLTEQEATDFEILMLKVGWI